MNNIKLVAVAMLSLAVGSMAHAVISIAGSVGGAPVGVNKVNFDSLPLGSVGGVIPFGGGTDTVTVSFAGDAAAVTGSVDAEYAAPFLSGGNGFGFGPGGTDQADGADATNYLAAGVSTSGGSVTLTFSAPQVYFGMLWGSVDDYNVLQFYNGATLVGTVTGSDVTAAPNGNQGVLGTLYVNFTSTDAFDRVVAVSQNIKTFEFDNIAFNETVPGPDPCEGCVYTQGFWKNHASAWPVDSLSLGTTSYTKAQLLSIFGTPVRGNGLISLAHQLIAAKLNVAKGACAPVDVANAIAAADLLIGGLVVPPVGSGTAKTSLTSVLTGILDAYNNGLAAGGPAHCD